MNFFEKIKLKSQLRNCDYDIAGTVIKQQFYDENKKTEVNKLIEQYLHEPGFEHAVKLIQYNPMMLFYFTESCKGGLYIRKNHHNQDTGPLKQTYLDMPDPAPPKKTVVEHDTIGEDVRRSQSNRQGKLTLTDQSVSTGLSTQEFIAGEEPVSYDTLPHRYSSKLRDNPELNDEQKMKQIEEVERSYAWMKEMIGKDKERDGSKLRTGMAADGPRTENGMDSADVDRQQGVGTDGAEEQVESAPEQGSITSGDPASSAQQRSPVDVKPVSSGLQQTAADEVPASPDLQRSSASEGPTSADKRSSTSGVRSAASARSSQTVQTAQTVQTVQGSLSKPNSRIPHAENTHLSLDKRRSAATDASPPTSARKETVRPSENVSASEMPAAPVSKPRPAVDFTNVITTLQIDIATMSKQAEEYRRQLWGGNEKELRAWIHTLDEAIREFSMAIDVLEGDE